MPWCPRCGEEFRPGIRSCPDCQAPLTEEPATEAAAPPGPPPPIFVAVSDPLLAERLEGLARRAGLPCLRVGDEARHGLVFPVETANRTLSFLLAHAPGVELVPPAAEGEPFALQPRDGGEPGALPGAQHLGRSAAELAADPAAQDGLVDLVLKGDPGTRAQALRRLLAAGDGGRRRLVALLRELALQVEEERLVQALDAVAGEELPGLEPAVGELLAHAEAEVVVLGLRIAWKLRLTALAGAACELLLHPDPLVQEEADEVLVEFTGVDLGFDPSLPEAQRRRLQEKRRRSLAGGG